MRSCTTRRVGELLATLPKILLHARSLTKCNLGGAGGGTAYSLLSDESDGFGLIRQTTWKLFSGSFGTIYYVFSNRDLAKNRYRRYS